MYVDMCFKKIQCCCVPLRPNKKSEIRTKTLNMNCFISGDLLATEHLLRLWKR